MRAQFCVKVEVSEWSEYFIYPRILERRVIVANISEHFPPQPLVQHNKGQSTTPRSSCPTPYDKQAGSFTSPANHNIEDAGDRAYGLYSLSEKNNLLPPADGFSPK